MAASFEQVIRNRNQNEDFGCVVIFDEAFNNKIGLSYEVDKPFPMSRELMVETLKAFEGLLDTLDQLL